MRSFMILAALLILSLPALADYHYASHEGTSEYPYTSWATAAHLIQDALDASEMKDTVFVGAGEYYELIEMQPEDSCVTIIGSGMNNTLIWTDQHDILFRRAQRTSFIDLGFRHEYEIGHILECRYFVGPNTHVYVNRCRFSGGARAIGVFGLLYGTEIIENCVFDTLQAYFQAYGCSLSVFRNNLCYREHDDPTQVVVNLKGYKAVVENNIIYMRSPSFDIAMRESTNLDTVIIRNNLIRHFWGGIWDLYRNFEGSQIAFNIFDRFYSRNGAGIHIEVQAPDSGCHIDIFNNSFSSVKRAIYLQGQSPYESPVASVDYNNFWDAELPVYYDHPGHFDSVGNIFVDPMYVGNGDYHLQAFSPLIDAGNPDVLDLDSSRSDIGLYGGPLGEAYAYQDLPPGIPDSIYACVAGDTISINWRYNTEADFNHYFIYRDTLSGFEPSIFNLLAEPETSLYIDTDFDPTCNYYYRITAVDNQGNVSDYSEELRVILTNIRGIFGIDVPGLASIISNYPNPFNSLTKIRYYVGNIGPMPVEIRILIYDVLGKEVRRLCRRADYPGEYEVIWDGRDNDGNELASGMYFTKIIQWEDLIESKPKKIMLLK